MQAHRASFDQTGKKTPVVCRINAPVSPPPTSEADVIYFRHAFVLTAQVADSYGDGRRDAARLGKLRFCNWAAVRSFERTSHCVVSGCDCGVFARRKLSRPGSPAGKRARNTNH